MVGRGGQCDCTADTEHGTEGTSWTWKHETRPVCSYRGQNIKSFISYTTHGSNDCLLFTVLSNANIQEPHYMDVRICLVTTYPSSLPLVPSSTSTLYWSGKLQFTLDSLVLPVWRVESYTLTLPTYGQSKKSGRREVKHTLITYINIFHYV